MLSFSFKNRGLKVFLKFAKIIIFSFVLYIILANITYDKFKRIQYNLFDNIHNIDDNAKIIKFNIDDFDRKKVNIYLIELKLTNRFDPLNLKLFLNHSLIKDKHINKGTKTLFIEFDSKILRKENILKIRSNHNKWTINNLIAKNVYGFSTKIISLNIINKYKIPIKHNCIADFSSFEKFILCLFIFLFSIMCIKVDNKYIKKEQSSILAKCLFFVCLFLVLFSILLQLITKYKIIYSNFTFSLLLSIILFCYFYFKGLSLKKTAIYIPAVIFFIFLLFILYDVQRGHNKNNFSSFIRFRMRNINRIPQNKIVIPTKNLIIREKGYDSQFFYYISFDPFLAKLDNPKLYRRFIDNPKYRYSRIGFPLLINIFSLGNKEIFPEIMILLILFSHLFAVFYLMKIVKFYQKNPYLAFLYLLVPGFIWSLDFALPESIAVAFFIAGYYYYLENRPIFYIFSFAFSILIRETAILFLIAIAIWELAKQRKLKTPILLFSSLIPFFLWRAYLTFRLFPVYGFSPFFYSSKVLSYPFFGFYQLYQHLYLGIYKFLILYPVAFIFPIIITLIFILSIKLISKKINLLNISLFLYSIMYVSLSFKRVLGHMGNVLRVTCDVFILLILAYISAEDNKNRILFMLIFLLLIILNIFSIKFFL